MEVLVKSESIALIAKALNEASKLFGGAEKSTDNTFFGSRYADLSSIIKAVKPGLDSAGIIILQPIVMDEAGKTYLQTMLLHTSGEFIASVIPLDLSGKEQVLGSRISYLRRYQLQALLSVPAVDDDGEAAMQRPDNQPPKGAASSKKTSVEDNRLNEINRMIAAFVDIKYTQGAIEKRIGKSAKDFTEEDLSNARKIYDNLMAKANETKQ